MATLQSKQSQVIGGMTWISEAKVQLTVTDESPSFTVKVSEHPVEDMGNISDHIQREAIEYNISGVVVGKNAWPTLSRLKEWNQKGVLLKYTGRGIIDNCIIESLDTSHTVEVGNGFEFNIKLRNIRVAKTSYKTLYGNDPVTLSKYTKTQITANKNQVVNSTSKKSADEQALEDYKKALLKWSSK